MWDGLFLRAGKVSMRANCENLFSGSCAVIRARPRPSDTSREVRGYCAERQPARSIDKFVGLVRALMQELRVHTTVLSCYGYKSF